MNRVLVCFATCLLAGSLFADDPTVLFDGKSLDHWEYNEGGWVIEEDGSMSCRMEEVKSGGKTRLKGKGYIWTEKDYQDFQLSLRYKLSEGCNSGVFYRTDPKNPVQGGFEIQLLDNAGFQKIKGKKDPKNLNGAFYDCQAAKDHQPNPVGQWNQLTLTVKGSQFTVELNGNVVNTCDIDDWDTANKNPDGSTNKFKTPLKQLPRTGRIGFQNHGQVVWFKDIKIKEL